MRPINKGARPEQVVHSMVQKMNAGLYSLSCLSDAEILSSSTHPSSHENASPLPLPPPSITTSLIPRPPNDTLDDEMEVDEAVVKDASVELEDEGHTTVVYSVLPPPPWSIAASRVPPPPNDILDNEIRADEVVVESASKSESTLGKNESLKSAALSEMEKWAISEGRMQDVLSCRKRVEPSWTPEKRIESYRTLIGLKDTLHSRNWKCIENGRMPLIYIYSFLGKSQMTFTRAKSFLTKLEEKKEMGLEDEKEGNKDERRRTKRSKRQKPMIKVEHDSDDSDQKIGMGQAASAPLSESRQNREVLFIRIKIPPSFSTAKASFPPKMKVESVPIELQDNSLSSPPVLPSPDESSTSHAKKSAATPTALQRDLALRAMKDWAVAEGRMNDVNECRMDFNPVWPLERKIKVLRLMLELKEALRSRNWSCVQYGLMPVNLIHASWARVNIPSKIWTCV
ncbi:hypothetical protein BT96DRAFT_255211 [Gymnopus androsaceus JB14]|uniref:Uncharacterized protein n=1 Tax=Gymnopus androsaceus JB14 TaxID=1447944 RepID=A0A6A4H755_9AGAR|nr:hypothetical protein BT96DRAFT_255211 [Gymnopus androsaceus JB14]